MSYANEILRRLRMLFARSHPLSEIDAPPLLGTIHETTTLYGAALTSEPHTDFPEATTYSFQPNSFFQIDVTEWKSRIHSIVFWSQRPKPVEDLQWVMQRYGEGCGWRSMEAGYWYVRDDDRVYLWCSAMPAIGLASGDFREAKSDYKERQVTETVMEKSLSHDGWLKGDVHWTPNDEIEELQRLAVLGQSEPLVRFAETSPLIAVSQRAEHVFVVRRHKAFECSDGFTELNLPPDEGNGASTQVINIFTHSDTGSSWGKVALPRNAEVQSVECHEGLVEVKIVRRDDQSLFVVRGTIRDIWALNRISAQPHRDSEMWERIQKKSGENS